MGIKDDVSPLDIWRLNAEAVFYFLWKSEPAYRKRVNIVVVLDVEQHHGASGAPPMMVSFIPHKLQHKIISARTSKIRIRAYLS